MSRVQTTLVKEISRHERVKEIYKSSYWGVPLNPFNAHSGQNQSDNFDEIIQVEAQLAKYYLEKYYLEYPQQPSFK